MSFFSGLAHDAKAMMTGDAWGFAPSDLKGLLPQYPRVLASRVFKLKTAEQMEMEAENRGSLKPTLGRVGLTCVGVGVMLGAGIFITPGYIAKYMTGPALFIAYLVASVSAFLSSFCYAEFSVNMPLAGAAYNYVAASLGEFTAWVTVSNLVLEWILANAAVIRGFSPYFALLIGKESGYFLYTWQSSDGNDYLIDWWAFGITILVTCLLCYGVKESTTANTIITIVHVLVMIFIIIAGFTKADRANFQPFFPSDQPDQWKQVFNGAAIAFFSFIGFDAVAAAAEEVVDPAKNMPIGILGSVSIVTIIYSLMCVALCLMVPRDLIDDGATFSAAFEYVGMNWASHIVAFGAILGIITGVMMGIYAAARILTGCCRERMLPPFVAWVGPKQTPWVATWIVGICTALIALMTPFAELANMISIGTFVVFWVVAVSLIWRRHHVPGQTSVKGLVLLGVHVLAMIGFSIGFVLVWTLPKYQPEQTDYDGNVVAPEGDWRADQYKWLIALAVLCAATPVSMLFFCKQEYIPEGYKVPLYPFVPCGSIFVNTFLLGQLDEKSYKRFGWWTLAVLGIYLTYSVFAAQTKDNKAACSRASSVLVGMGDISQHAGDEKAKAATKV